jgi:hypothetical protein
LSRERSNELFGASGWPTTAPSAHTGTIPIALRFDCRRLLCVLLLVQCARQIFRMKRQSLLYESSSIKCSVSNSSS